MAFEDFLNHKCDIYHIAEKGNSPGYGLPADTVYVYPDLPDIAECICHFGVGDNLNTVQGEPYKALEGRIKLTLPYGTDIRINDKVLSCETGLTYTAEIPRNVRNHHVIVWIKRDTGTEGAI